jgi:hypothetical protein
VRIEQLPGGVDLTYCTNIHAGESWGEIEAALDVFVPAIKRSLGFDGQFGIGLRLSAQAAGTLNDQDVLARFAAQLERLGAYVFTINAFPYGPFHGAPVKECVYLPDWRSPERLRFTCDAAQILARLLPEGGFGSLSTVPGGFKADLRSDNAVAAIVVGLTTITAELVRIARDTGRVIVLALEPEPACLLETVEDAVAFFTEHLFGPAAIRQLAGKTGLSTVAAAEALRRHLGVCYDVCHGSVLFENPLQAISRLRAAGITVAKIQLSAAIKVPALTQQAGELLLALDDGVYLHQTAIRDGEGVQQFVDLPEALSAFGRGTVQGETRVHCHVPLYLSQFGALGTTQGDLLSVLEAVRHGPLAPHLEVETYTWDVLPAGLRGETKAAAIAEELRFVREVLLRPLEERAA